MPRGTEKELFKAEAARSGVRVTVVTLTARQFSGNGQSNGFVNFVEKHVLMDGGIFNSLLKFIIILFVLKYFLLNGFITLKSCYFAIPFA